MTVVFLQAALSMLQSEIQPTKRLPKLVKLSFSQNSDRFYSKIPKNRAVPVVTKLTLHDKIVDIQ